MTVKELHDELKKLLGFYPEVATNDISIETSVDVYESDYSHSESIRRQVCYAHYDGLNVTLSAY